jgi:hypothetical protein
VTIIGWVCTPNSAVPVNCVDIPRLSKNTTRHPIEPIAQDLKRLNLGRNHPVIILIVILINIIILIVHHPISLGLENGEFHSGKSMSFSPKLLGARGAEIRDDDDDDSTRSYRTERTLITRPNPCLQNNYPISNKYYSTKKVFWSIVII